MLGYGTSNGYVSTIDLVTGSYSLQSTTYQNPGLDTIYALPSSSYGGSIYG